MALSRRQFLFASASAATAAVIATAAVRQDEAFGIAYEVVDQEAGSPVATIRPTNRPRGSVTPDVPTATTLPRATATLRPTARPRTSVTPDLPDPSDPVEATATLRPTPRPRT